METLTIGGKEFVKASKAAREYGYTADYIGQLCRGGKVNAKLVGRSWYVSQESLDFHRANRYQKETPKVTSTEPREGYRVAIDTKTETEPEAKLKTEAVAKPKPTSQSAPDKAFYTHVRKPLTVASYATDETALIPEVAKLEIGEKGQSAVIPVDLAEASSVEISVSDKQYNFKTPKRPKISFSGALEIEEVTEPQPVTLKPLAEEIEPKNTAQPASVAIKRASPATSSPRKRFPIRTRMSPLSRHTDKSRTGTLKVNKVAAETPAVRSPLRYLVVATSIVAIIVTVAMLGFQSEVVVAAADTNEKISFTIEHLLASVYGLK